MEQTTIEGEKLLGKFRVGIRTDEFWGGSEYTEYKYKGFWYEGVGLIEDKETGKKYSFALVTNHFRGTPENNCTLEEAIVNFNQRSPFYAGDFKPKVVNGFYKRIVDLSLRDLVSQVEDSNEDIPEITPKRLRVDELVEKGYCSEEDGQIRLALVE